MTRRRVFQGHPQALDRRTAGEAFSFPGIDPRTWISYGIVSAADPQDVVHFDDDSGQPYVRVTLEPSKVQAYCRVASQVAGNGEADWHPFVQNDEVLVACPMGYEDASPVIIGRLNNLHDKFPTESVAGQDPTTNTFGFRRRRSPVIEEYAGPFLFRSATTGAFISADTVGTITLRDGQGDALQISADAFGYQDASGNYLIQMNVGQGIGIIQAKDAYFQIAASDSGAPSVMLIPTALSVVTSGDTASEHAATTEGVANILANLFQALGVAIIAAASGPITGTQLGGIFQSPTFGPILAAALTTAATSGLSAEVLAAIVAAMNATQPQKLGGQLGQTNPGIGCRGLIVG